MANTSSRSKVSTLQLTFPPISNQEAVWLQEDPAAEMQLRASDFYMIGARAEAKFSDFSVAGDNNDILDFKFSIGGGTPDAVRLYVNRLPSVKESKQQTFSLQAGDKFIRVVGMSNDDPEETVVDWFTTEKLLFDRWRGNPAIEGLERLREFATYDLLYVGIAKTGDSFDRLIANGHKARTDILSNEPQRYPGARVTDEVYLFLFHVNPLVITTFEANHEFTDDDLGVGVKNKIVVADAEKAFVSLLKPKYNVVRFSKYPQGADGLYSSDLLRYAYLIGEDLSFNTAHGRIKGAYGSFGALSNDADSIFVDGDNVSLLVSGVDFPGDP